MERHYTFIKNLSTLLLLTVTLSACQFLEGANINQVTHTSTPALLTLDIAKNWTESLTGFLKPDGSPIALSVQKTVIIPGNPGGPYTLKCRSAYKPLIQSAAYTDCTAGTYQPTPTAGAINLLPNNNGTYQFDVEAFDSAGNLVGSSTVDYYVHPSLDQVPLCNHAHTPTDYYTAAGALLDQSSAFNSATTLNAPFYHFNFDLNTQTGTIIDRSQVSLRKEYLLNSTRTLGLVWRTRPKWLYHASGVGYTDRVLDGGVELIPESTHYVERPSNMQSNYQTVDSKCTMSVSLFDQAQYTRSYTLVDDGSGTPLLDQVMYREAYFIQGSTPYFPGSSQYTDSTIYNELMVDPSYYLTHGLTIPRHMKFASTGNFAFQEKIQTEITAGTRFTSNQFMSYRHIICDVIVFNAKGKGVCFHDGLLNDTLPLKNMQHLITDTQKDLTRVTDSKHNSRQRLSGLSRPKLTPEHQNYYTTSVAPGSFLDPATEVMLTPVNH